MNEVSENIEKSYFASTSTGKNLDMLGIMHGITRKPNESDDEYRNEIKHADIIAAAGEDEVYSD